MVWRRARTSRARTELRSGNHFESGEVGRGRTHAAVTRRAGFGEWRCYGQRPHRDWNRPVKKASVLGSCRAYLTPSYVAHLSRPRGQGRNSARWGRLERNGDRAGQHRDSSRRIVGGRPPGRYLHRGAGAAMPRPRRVLRLNRVKAYCIPLVKRSRRWPRLGQGPRISEGRPLEACAGGGRPQRGACATRPTRHPARWITDRTASAVTSRICHSNLHRSE